MVYVREALFEGFLRATTAFALADADVALQLLSLRVSAARRTDAALQVLALVGPQRAGRHARAPHLHAGLVALRGDLQRGGRVGGRVGGNGGDDGDVRWG